MPVLPQPRQEQYAQFRASGYESEPAALAAGFSAKGATARTSAFEVARLMEADPAVIARIVEIEHERRRARPLSVKEDTYCRLRADGQSADYAMHEAQLPQEASDALRLSRKIGDRIRHLQEQRVAFYEEHGFDQPFPGYI